MTRSDGSLRGFVGRREGERDGEGEGQPPPAAAAAGVSQLSEEYQPPPQHQHQHHQQLHQQQQQQRNLPRKPARPSTAPSAPRDVFSLLPSSAPLVQAQVHASGGLGSVGTSTDSTATDFTSTSSSSYPSSDSGADSSADAVDSVHSELPLQPVMEDDATSTSTGMSMTTSMGIDDHHHHLQQQERLISGMADATQHPQQQAPQHQHQQQQHQQQQNTLTVSECDWATFIAAYAAGRWDPHRTPNKPMPCHLLLADSMRFAGYDVSSSSAKMVRGGVNEGPVLGEGGQPPTQDGEGIPLIKFDDPSASSSSAATQPLSAVSEPGSSSKPHLTMPLRLPHRFRNSFSTSTSSSSSTTSTTSSSNAAAGAPPHPSAVSDVHAAVATMRWAAARVDISPLALPSPEHELTDPMRGVTAAIPGSHPVDGGYEYEGRVGVDCMVTPGGTRRSRLNGFWEGTTDVDGAGMGAGAGVDRLETILASPPEVDWTGVPGPDDDDAGGRQGQGRRRTSSDEANHGHARGVSLEVEGALHGDLESTSLYTSMSGLTVSGADLDLDLDLEGLVDDSVSTSSMSSSSLAGVGTPTPTTSAAAVPAAAASAPTTSATTSATSTSPLTSKTSKIHIGSSAPPPSSSSYPPHTHHPRIPPASAPAIENNNAPPSSWRTDYFGDVTGLTTGWGPITETKSLPAAPDSIGIGNATANTKILPSTSGLTLTPATLSSTSMLTTTSSAATNISNYANTNVSATAATNGNGSFTSASASTSTSTSTSTLNPSSSSSSNTTPSSSSNPDPHSHPNHDHSHNNPSQQPSQQHHHSHHHDSENTYNQPSTPTSVPALPRRLALTRQTSSPLPESVAGSGVGVGVGMGAIGGGFFVGGGGGGGAGGATAAAPGAPGAPRGAPPNTTTDNPTPEDPTSTPATATPTAQAPTATATPTPTTGPTHPKLKLKLKLGRAAKEERMFSELGYLAPPYPPDELERRRALYKFNIWNTGPDMNFDRIAHLAKLVFSTKGVLVSLIDGNEQGYENHQLCARAFVLWAYDFTADVTKHAIFEYFTFGICRGDEPMVILDTHKDWRFEKNPLTIGAPHIRFYAGAPLRTHDGFNIGTLAVIDDQPREEFSPRQRHTLKEFAAIATREMELWSDKIQLRIRDRIQNSMEQFSRECLEIDTETHASYEHPDLLVGSSMDKVYDRAAKLVKRTLDVEGVLVMDVAHTEVLETMSAAEGTVSVALHHGEVGREMSRRQLSHEEYRRLGEFFEKYPDGRVSEGIVPQSFKPFLPTHVQYALTVPIFNIDKRPFALLCAYNTHEHAKRFLEGHELSYLRAIGVIILSAVLKRRMLLADKAKGLFISNISHELRTPLHGILAAAELLSESNLNHSQQSFLQTVQACGTSLVETVNHVLDFTKLSGNSKAGGVENVIVPSTVDLMQLVEEAVDGCWIGHRARTASMEENGIGSVYSPPKEDRGSPVATRRKHVETIVDIGYRPEGWTLKCEKGGIRRILMNLFGNSLKFTSDGYVHVLLRQLPPAENDPPNKVRVELAVFDTGKTGTGLGLAIVSSIVTSENVSGKVDVWSEEGVGTEIKVTFPAEKVEGQPLHDAELFRSEEDGTLPTVSLVGFSTPHKGVQLLDETIRSYLTTWWGFEIVDEDGDIVIMNEDPSLVLDATRQRDTQHAYIILSSSRGSPGLMSIASDHERIGGFCRILYKPGGPSRLLGVLKVSIHALRIGNHQDRMSSPMGSINGDSTQERVSSSSKSPSGSGVRRNSEETGQRSYPYMRRPTTPRSHTAHPLPTKWGSTSTKAPEPVEVVEADTPVPTISLGTGGTLLKSSIGSLDAMLRFRVLVVEDNSILRNLLIKWLSNKGYEFAAAVNGREGVNVFREEGPFDVVLLDLSMPILDGVGATIEIRQIEADMVKVTPGMHPSRILALTGMSTLEDKRRAFDAGVDGYLVKPVAFKTLDDMFHKLGVS
ncbi:Sensor histidine kinase GacS [Psilocybe cubensis]|uniref:Sensor histidine kinase GacS n=1 Tax=Psilocybe cubensis TaxID=181762 RepID=A0ACB8H1Y1_PSICU|nr:Sensor histidine kinase GacS [Psilocybe cubensis]KAH9481647.1 Sensor histidine kinase GacS [Psilocybe cubensis]